MINRLWGARQVSVWRQEEGFKQDHSSKPRQGTPAGPLRGDLLGLPRNSSDVSGEGAQFKLLQHWGPGFVLAFYGSWLSQAGSSCGSKYGGNVQRLPPTTHGEQLEDFISW